MITPLLSIVIPTRNRANDLLICLESVSQQREVSVPYEVIVVDNGSNDNTREIVRVYGKLIKEFSCHFVESPGLHEGRHVGMLKCRSEWLAYLDDDVELPAEWLKNVLNAIEGHKDAILIGSRVLPKFLEAPPDWILQRWNKNKILGELSIIDLGEDPKWVDPFHVFGCSFIIKKEFLIKIGGFHPDGMPWDSIRFRGDGESFVSRELKKRGMKAFYSPEIKTYHRIHPERLTDSYFNKRHYMQGISDAYTHLRSIHLERMELPLKDDSGWSINTVKKIIFRLLKFKSTKKLEAERFKKSYENGFTYLLNQFENNTEVKMWILKENYLQYDREN